MSGIAVVAGGTVASPRRCCVLSVRSRLACWSSRPTIPVIMPMHFVSFFFFTVFISWGLGGDAFGDRRLKG